MAIAGKKQRGLNDDQLLRGLTKIFFRHGIAVRRENLTRGTAYRVKSGNCSFNGKDLIFVDKRLPAAQQVSFLVDCLVETKLALEQSELGMLPPSARTLLSTAMSASA